MRGRLLNLFVSVLGSNKFCISQKTIIWNMRVNPFPELVCVSFLAQRSEGVSILFGSFESLVMH